MTLTNVTITAYCACRLCCGPTAPNPTASGKWPRPNHTIAAPRHVPFNTKVLVTIPGLMTNAQYTAEDRLSRRFPHRWDIFMTSHAAARRFGIRTGTITLR